MEGKTVTNVQDERKLKFKFLLNFIKLKKKFSYQLVESFGTFY